MSNLNFSCEIINTWRPILNSSWMLSMHPPSVAVRDHFRKDRRKFVPSLDVCCKSYVLNYPVQALNVDLKKLSSWLYPCKCHRYRMGLVVCSFILFFILSSFSQYILKICLFILLMNVPFGKRYQLQRWKICMEWNFAARKYLFLDWLSSNLIFFSPFFLNIFKIKCYLVSHIYTVGSHLTFGFVWAAALSPQKTPQANCYFIDILFQTF